MSSEGDPPAGRKEDDDQDPTLDEQLDAIGWGRFQFLALTAFILFIVADGMEVPSTPLPLCLSLERCVLVAAHAICLSLFGLNNLVT